MLAHLLRDGKGRVILFVPGTSSPSLSISASLDRCALRVGDVAAACRKESGDVHYLAGVHHSDFLRHDDLGAAASAPARARPRWSVPHTGLPLGAGCISRDSGGDDGNDRVLPASRGVSESGVGGVGHTVLLVLEEAKAEASNAVVTVEAGYAYKPDSKVNVDIEGPKYKLYTRNRNNDSKGDAWAVGDDGDKALIAAMKAGKSMVVKGTSSRGTLTTDTYSLSGFTAAYNAIDQACKSG